MQHCRLPVSCANAELSMPSPALNALVSVTGPLSSCVCGCLAPRPLSSPLSKLPAEKGRGGKRLHKRRRAVQPTDSQGHDVGSLTLRDAQGAQQSCTTVSWSVTDEAPQSRPPQSSPPVCIHITRHATRSPEDHAQCQMSVSSGATLDISLYPSYQLSQPSLMFSRQCSAT